MKEPIYTMGIDVGGSYIKGVIMRYSETPEIVDQLVEKIRKRNPEEVAAEMVTLLRERNSLTQEKSIAYMASTGEGEMVKGKQGHFYSMTTHAKGGKFFYDNARTVVDLGALYVRAIKVDERGKVLDYQMTGQCASGSGQFIENISRYLGLSIQEVGEISLQADEPEMPSGICAVLAETDVINSVSRGITIPNIIKGIHLSIANRVVRLIKKLKAETPVVLVGGMALNQGMVQAIQELLQNGKDDIEIVTTPNAIYSGAIGAALWGGYRHHKLKLKNQLIGID